MAAVRQTLDYLCRLHQDPDIDRLAPALAAGFPDYLMSLLLMQLPHNYSDALRADRRQPLPLHVRRARDYIESHLDEAVTLAELAALSGVSTRTLQNGFARFLGQSPIDYIRGLRLARVHAALEQAGPGDNVTDILLRHGVTSFGHFASHYRKRYGCRPSDTLRVASAGTGRRPRLGSAAGAAMAVFARRAQHRLELAGLARIGMLGGYGQRDARQAVALRSAGPEAVGDLGVRHPGHDARRLA
ncbi:AraC family transcriptional regulator [Achromobacter xylosoxidans]